MPKNMCKCPAPGWLGYMIGSAVAKCENSHVVRKFPVGSAADDPGTGLLCKYWLTSVIAGSAIAACELGTVVVVVAATVVVVVAGSVVVVGATVVVVVLEVGRVVVVATC